MIDIVNQLSLLVKLSKADNFLAKPESDMIHYLGNLYGLTENEIETIIDYPKPVSNLMELDLEDKFDYLFNMVQLMKIDGKVFKSEIDFCKKTAILLGYNPNVIADLSAYIYSDPDITTKRSFLEEITNKHLINKEDI